MGDEQHDDFDALISDSVDEVRSEPAEPAIAPAAPEAVARRSGRWGLVVASGAILLGLGCLGTVAVALGQADAAPVDETAPEAPTEAPDPRRIASESSESETRPKGIIDAVDSAWADETAEATGIPKRALQAYAGAALRVSEESPGCGIGWNTLAGIGYVESEHGTIDGGGIGPSGDTTPPIRGIALDGTSTERIADTDDGFYDDDSTWDRAVGPMQFIPSTWKEWNADGNGDGEADPQNIDDGSLAAARYLCEIGGDLTQPDRWIAAVAAYNDTVEYNNRVAEAADHYAALAP
ncbi:lytic transglycosylase domain-containing protein [Leucobacter sp. GX24907]